MQISIGGYATQAQCFDSPIEGIAVTPDGSWLTLDGTRETLIALANELIDDHLAAENGDECCRRAARAILREVGEPVPWRLIRQEVAARAA